MSTLSLKPKHDLIVFIGRFQPVHVGHIEVIKAAMSQAKHVVVLIGSSFKPRTSKNPWNYIERQKMIYDSIADINHATSESNFIQQVTTWPLRDATYNDQQWAQGVQEAVDTMHKDVFGAKPIKIAVIGHTKDDSSYYLKMFPQWDLIEHEMNDVVSATDVREIMYENKSDKFFKGVLTKPVCEFVHAFRETEEYALLKTEFEMIKKYRKSWEAAPYPVNLVTVDACVIQSGHILLIKRNAMPGQGLLALPGGYLEVTESVQDGVIRELREETKLRVPTPVLVGNIKSKNVYDHVARSLRGRIITHAYLIELPPGPLPAVKGGDDAAKAFWLPLSELNEENMFEDHFSMIQSMLGL